MKLRVSVSLTILLSLTWLCLSPALGTTPQAVYRISTAEEIKADFASVPCKDAERLTAVKALFQKMGASSADINVEKYRNVENLVVSKSGASQDKIIIGAHYDKVSEGCGAIDNWTGIVTLAHLYRSVKDSTLKKTIVFVAFGKEEEGLVGSRAMVNAISKDQLSQYCEMINIDSLGLAAPQVADNMSSQKLEGLAAEIAHKMAIPFGHASIGDADADSSSFLSRKIPALTLHGLTNDWPSILHSSKDQPSKINPTSVYLGYRLALALAARLDEAECSAYR